MTKFSIIVPLYNKAPYVRRTLESVIAQTYKDFECIVVDDGSTDGSLEIVRAINDEMSRANTLNEPQSLNDGRLTIISQTNAGVAAARNNGVAASKGEYVCFLDADDWWDPTFLEEMDRLIKEYPDAGLYATNYVYYKPGNTRVWLDFKAGYLDYAHAYLIQPAMPVWTGAACMPRKVFDEIGGFPEGINLGEDFLLWAKTVLYYKLAFCEKPLAYYNNDVPASLRATRNLHAPEHHMLFNLEPLLDEINRLQSTSNKSAWLQLIDKLRVDGLLEYWMSEEYHDAAAAELKKVDWSQQPRSAKVLYEKPIWLLKTKRRFIQVGSYFKKKLIKMCNV